MTENRKPYELKVAIKKDRDDTSKTYWTTIGKGWPNSKGGFKIELAPGVALMPGDTAEVMLWPPYDGARSGGGGGSRGGGGRQTSYDDAPDAFGDDDIPF